MLAKADSILEAVLGIFVAVLPLLFLGAFFLWVIRLVTTLRERLDAIEDKLDHLLSVQQCKSPTDQDSKHGKEVKPE